MTNIKATRQAVISKARQIFQAGVSESWSECMTLAWAFVKTANLIKAGKPFAFVKKTTGERRVVAAPAPFVAGPKKTTKSNRKPNPCILLFVDTEKGGTRSCDVRTLCA